MRVTRDAFDAAVRAALDQLPPRFRRYLENVALVVADAPSPRQRRSARLRPYDRLFGLYEGIPRTAREGRPAQLPDTITLFQQDLAAVSADAAALAREIRETLIHEIGHHLGLSEARVRRAVQKSRDT